MGRQTEIDGYTHYLSLPNNYYTLISKSNYIMQIAQVQYLPISAHDYAIMIRDQVLIIVMDVMYDGVKEK